MVIPQIAIKVPDAKGEVTVVFVTADSKNVEFYQAADKDIYRVHLPHSFRSTPGKTEFDLVDKDEYERIHRYIAEHQEE